MVKSESKTPNLVVVRLAFSSSYLWSEEQDVLGSVAKDREAAVKPSDAEHWLDEAQLGGQGWILSCLL